MEEISDFDKEYFLQTRKEIDMEKRERDQILNFAIIILGALGFAFVQSDKAKEFVKHPQSIMFEVSTLIILTSLFWVRRKKLQQISDRWYTLYRMAVRNLGKELASETMEAVVIYGFEKARYMRKDVVLNYALSLPIYTLLFISAYSVQLPLLLKLFIALTIVVIHVIISFCILATKMQDPFLHLIPNKERIRKPKKA